MYVIRWWEPADPNGELRDVAALEASGANAVLDEDFARDVKESIQTYREPWNPPSVD